MRRAHEPVAELCGLNVEVACQNNGPVLLGGWQGRAKATEMLNPKTKLARPFVDPARMPEQVAVSFSVGIPATQSLEGSLGGEDHALFVI